MNIINKKRWYFLLSGLIIIPGLVSLLLFGLRFSIDFTGGTLTEFKMQSAKPADKIAEGKKLFEKEGLEVSSVQESGNNRYIFRTKEINKEKHEKIVQEFKNKFGQVEELRFETVGPVIGKELTQKAFLSVLVASVMVVVYIAYSFRKVPKPTSSWKFGIAAIVALLHDVLVVVGIFSIMGQFYKVEVDTLFVTAILTVIGFSVHDTIVVFDRIRENLRKMGGNNFAYIVNESIMQTLTRSLSTSLTVIFTLFALLLFSESNLRWFVVALLVGIVSGTYSSIFNAAPILVVWQEFEDRKKKLTKLT